MNPSPSQPAGLARTKNIVISGTNFWNPGDDFVRDGVIRVLQEVFAGETLNLLFYNFNADFFPQRKFAGIANYLAQGDLEKYHHAVDAVVIAGLSAGEEIKDLYQWLIANGLQDRVYLIGAGYENDYVAHHLGQEPEATIFKHARLIIGRTAKRPQSMAQSGRPYVHLNCPAILSVPEVKAVPAGKKVERIGFSIQLPHGVGLQNHSCAREQYQLAMEVLGELSQHYAVEIVAHHKSEYFHFLELFRNKPVPVVFSSFYQDLHRIYSRYDLVVTTRLHASLFANGHGLPGVILNDTDRHTHTLEGFPHSVWVGHRAGFDAAFARWTQADLAAIARESAAFKSKLLAGYVHALRPVLAGRGVGSPEPRETATPAPDQALSEDFAAALLTALQESENKRRVLKIIAQLEKDYWLEQNLIRYQDERAWFDTATLLNWIARKLKPENYLEIGVRRGRSMSQVLVESPATQAYGFDLWIPDYASIPERGIHTPNPGPEFVLGELTKLGVTRLPKLVRGDSHATVPAFFQDPASPQSFELILVDGDHTTEGARADLEIAFAHLAPGGILIFDDIGNSAHPELRGLWDEFIQRYPDYLFINDHTAAGTGVAFRPTFNKLSAALKHPPTPPTPSAACPAAPVSTTDLPVHFFTIVLNGLPFLQHHLAQMRQLPFRWHWHIVEGVAELNHDTAWSQAAGGKIPATLHRNGLSVDGTTQYLDAIRKEEPAYLTIYRPPPGMFWDGKRAMVNAPLANIPEACLLWQVDADELWTASQFARMRTLFLERPEKTAALFHCQYFVGPRLVITSRDTYGNYPNEWLRVWRYQPGDRWQAHEPPRLCRGEVEVGAANVFRQAETEASGLVFQHYAYALEAQVQFKETYYGYSGAVSQWRQLQQASNFPLRLADYLRWVKDEARVNTIEAGGIQRLARQEWFPAPPAAAKPIPALAAAQRILFVRTDSIGDAVLASAMLEPIHKQFPQAKLAVLCQLHVAGLYTACPFLDSIIAYDHKKMESPSERAQIISEITAFRPDVVLNSVRSRDKLSDELTLAFADAQHIAIAGDLDNISAADRERARTRYSLLVPTADEHQLELKRHADFLRGLGIAAPALKPVVWTSAEDEALADAFFQQQGLNPAQTIAVFPGAQSAMRVYPAYAEALKPIEGYRFLIFGDATQSPLAEELVRQLPGRTLNLCGRTTLRSLAALLRRCRLYVGAESAGAHLACALGVPNVVLLGGGHFGRFMPYSALTSAVVLPLYCYGCNWHCKYASPLCVQNLEPHVLAQAMAATLQSRSQRPRIFAQVDQAGLPAVLPALAPWLPLETVEIIPVQGEQPIPNCWPTLQYGRGVHKEEPGFRWLDADAELEVTIPAEGGSAAMSFELQAAPMPLYPRAPFKVALRVNGQLDQEVLFQNNNQIETVRLTLPPAARPHRLHFASSQFFTSAADPRHLSVRLQKIALAPEKNGECPNLVLEEADSTQGRTCRQPTTDVNHPMHHDIHPNGSGRQNGQAHSHTPGNGSAVNAQRPIAVVQAPADPAAEFIKAAQAHIAAGNLQACCEAMRDAAAAVPGDAQIIATLGRVYFQMGDFQEARKRFEQALQFDPGNAGLLVQMATTCQRLGDLAGLTNALQQALALAPTNEEALTLLAGIHFEACRFDHAAKVYELLLARNPGKVGWLLLLAKCRFQMGNLPGSRELYELVRRIEPGNAIATEALQRLDAKSCGTPQPAAGAPVIEGRAGNGNRAHASATFPLLCRQAEIGTPGSSSVRPALQEESQRNQEEVNWWKKFIFESFDQNPKDSEKKFLDRFRKECGDRWRYICSVLNLDVNCCAEGAVLDVGNGPCGLVNFIPARIKVGIDPNNELYQHHGILYNVNHEAVFMPARAEAIPLLDHTFDFVTCVNVLDHTNDPVAILNEIYRLLKPGGIFWLSVDTRKPEETQLVHPHAVSEEIVMAWTKSFACLAIRTDQRCYDAHPTNKRVDAWFQKPSAGADASDSPNGGERDLIAKPGGDLSPGAARGVHHASEAGANGGDAVGIRAGSARGTSSPPVPDPTHALTSCPAPASNGYAYRPDLCPVGFEQAAELLAAGIPNPVVRAWPKITAQSCDEVAGDLTRQGIPVQELKAPASSYASFLAGVDYPVHYPTYYRHNLPEKSFEHFCVCLLLKLNPSDVFLDIASEGSPLPDIVSRLSGCTAYAQDIMYPPGIAGNRIGGDASHMPIGDGFATAAALTCSLEHFEGDSDTRLFAELGRVLRPGGRVCVIPLYLYSEPITVTDPVYAVSAEVQFDAGATVYCAKGWGNRHGRHYSAESLIKRIIAPAAHLFKFQIVHLRGIADLHASLYAHFALLAERL